MAYNKLDKLDENLAEEVIELPCDLEIISQISWDNVEMLNSTDFADLPELESFNEDIQSLSDGHINIESKKQQQSNLKLDELNKYITTSDELNFIKTKLVNLEEQITNKLDKYHKAIREQERKNYTKTCKARTTTNYPGETHLQQLNIPPGKTKIINHGTIIYTHPTAIKQEPSTNTLDSITPITSLNIYVYKWLTNFKPVLEKLFSPLQTEQQIQFHDETIKTILSELRKI